VQGSIKLKQDPAVAAKVSKAHHPPAPVDGAPAFKDQVRRQQRHSVVPPQQQREDIRDGPRFKDQCANAQNVPTSRQSPDPDQASPEAETSQEMLTGLPMPLTAQVVDDHELEEQIRRQILGEAVAAQAVSPSQL